MATKEQDRQGDFDQIKKLRAHARALHSATQRFYDDEIDEPTARKELFNLWDSIARQAAERANSLIAADSSLEG